MKKILFVCMGNLARSQMAMAYYNKMTRSDRASSAGILSYTAERNKHPLKEAIEVMKEEAIDISKNKITALTPEIIEKNDRIIAMCDKSECPFYLLKSGKDITFWDDIYDPIGKGIEDFRKTRDQIKKKVKAIV